MLIELASLQDAEEILALQKLAYLTEAEIYGDHSIPPLTQTLGQMAEDFTKQAILKATLDGKIVGSVRGYSEESTCHVGRLIVHPDFRNRGFGTLLMRAIEGHFADAARFELFTGHLSEGNLRLYRRLGYESFAEKPVTDRLTLVFLEKKNLSASR
jgi:ribosomal protein S18 acetylase RimI-like enzyme